MLAELALLGCNRYLGASPLLSVLLMEDLRYNLYLGGRRAPMHPVGQPYARAQ